MDSFIYNHEPHLADFFYHYARALPEMHGVNTSVTPASTEDATLARMILELPTAMCMFKIVVSEDPAVEDSSSLMLIIP